MLEIGRDIDEQLHHCVHDLDQRGNFDGLDQAVAPPITLRTNVIHHPLHGEDMMSKIVAAE
jgi:hypothetical protein